jgi:hypothetical protein
VQSTTTALCFYTSPAAAGAVYGVWTPAGTGAPVAATDECRGALPNGTRTSNVAEGVGTYNCGCCGVISRRGEATNYMAQCLERRSSTTRMFMAYELCI